MKAYGVFEGGGVKGVALAGAYKAALENDVDFIGFGGTSAGAIVALLAS
ncbi:patatin-like phospholipase family protein [Alteromonas gracilis]